MHYAWPSVRRSRQNLIKSLLSSMVTEHHDLDLWLQCSWELRIIAKRFPICVKRLMMKTKKRDPCVILIEQTCGTHVHWQVGSFICALHHDALHIFLFPCISFQILKLSMAAAPSCQVNVFEVLHFKTESHLNSNIFEHTFKKYILNTGLSLCLLIKIYNVSSGLLNSLSVGYINIY
jgi:hypothetical protein